MLAGKIGYFRASFDPRNLPGLVAYWPMSEDASLTNAQALDVSGNGFHLTSSGALSNPGRALRGRLLAAQGGQWNPSSARLSRGSWNTTPQWDANATGWSVAFWLFTDLTNNTQGTSSTAAIINFSTVASAVAESVRFGGGTPANGFAAISSRCYFTDNTFLSYASGVNITGGMTSITPQGQWTHMAFVADPATRTYTMFVNGVARTPIAYTADKVLSSFSSGIPCLMQWPGTIDEVVVYNRAISASEVLRLAGVPLSASSPSTLHPECRSWISRVLSNGGTVSTTTATAVNDFCAAIDAAGIRDRFFRLNLFAGTGLSAALVPLFRGPSLGGTQWGNSTDTNFNIVSGDYAETGTGGGLNGGSTKYLATGLAPNAAGISAFNTHLAFYSRVQNTLNACPIGGFGGGGPQSTWQMLAQGQFNAFFYRSGGASNSGIENVAWSGANRSGHIMAVRSGANAAKLYRNGTDLAVTATTTNSNVWTSQDVFPLFVFGRNNVGTADQLGYTQKLQCYSAGLSMTDAQASAYFTAVQAFQTALGRQL